jgi:hypothetical protein
MAINRNRLAMPIKLNALQTVGYRNCSAISTEFSLQFAVEDQKGSLIKLPSSKR